jgi:hypothetical protein
MKVCEIVIYTTGGALTFDVVPTVDNFQEVLSNALEEGTVVVDTVEGSQLVLNAVNVVAIEIKDVCEKEIAEDTPPIVKNLSSGI